LARRKWRAFLRGRPQQAATVAKIAKRRQQAAQGKRRVAQQLIAGTDQRVLDKSARTDIIGLAAVCCF
jgi:hypothetical protein